VPSAAEFARGKVRAVRDDPRGRLALLRRLYEGSEGNGTTHLPYRRAATAFMDWQLRRGLLAADDAPVPGSRWWRAVNERLLRDGWEALGLAMGMDATGSAPSAAASVDFIRRPTSRNWYRAHNSSVVAGYLDNVELAEAESRTERFFVNLVLIRVLYAHALVAAPRLALGRLSLLAPVLGDPRLGMTGIFLSVSRILPATYPLGDDVERYVSREHGFGRLLDTGIIQPRLRHLFDWSAQELGEPRLAQLFNGDVPCYAWPGEDRQPWLSRPTIAVRLALRALPPSTDLLHRPQW
jgi:hypothetical protein